MKTKMFLALLTLALVFVACAPNEPKYPEPIRVATAEHTDLTMESVHLVGTMTGDREPYQSFVYAFLFSTDEEEVLNRQAEVFYTRHIYDGTFSVSLVDLVPGTTYYYCAWVMLNGTDYLYGDVKSFTTPKESYIPKAFTVSATKKVYFSKGNLQYQPSTNQWRFADKQYDIVGVDNHEIDNANYEGWLDLFGWGTGANPTLCTTNPDDYQTFVDWGANVIGDDAPNTWRTLSEGEWLYLIRMRPNASNLFKTMTVNGVFGYLILPDDWEKTVLDLYYSNESSQWFVMEQAGAVFLPAPGTRSGITAYAPQKYAFYWTSTKGNGQLYARAIKFDVTQNGTKHIWQGQLRDIYKGYAVRLVRDVETENE